jgi:hypothetical protein
MKTSIKLILPLLTGLLLMGPFQNCSKIEFSEAEQPSQKKQGDPVLPDDPDPADLVLTEPFSKATEEVFDKVDVLFVVDESSSMNKILTNMNEGFAAISANQYTTDTQMAVTNTAPAWYSAAAQNSIDFTRSFKAATATMSISDQPGFMRLVDGATIASFTAAHSSLGPKFPMSGCSAAWFKPKDVNGNGQSCLSAHTQVALQSIGVEAGVISFDQLVRKTQLDGKRLFRDGALANVIFVSDTHDAGDPYYGMNGAKPSMPSYSSLRQIAEMYNPGIVGLKFHGIVPLPPAGDSHLQNVTTIGNLPATISQSKISSESLNDFSYLPYIAQSGGVAMHPVKNDWVQAIEQIVKEVSIRRSASVTLAHAIKSLVEIQVEGQVLSPSDYTIQADGRTILIPPHDTWPSPVQIVVKYTSL